MILFLSIIICVILINNLIFLFRFHYYCVFLIWLIILLDYYSSRQLFFWGITLLGKLLFWLIIILNRLISLFIRIYISNKLFIYFYLSNRSYSNKSIQHKSLISINHNLNKSNRLISSKIFLPQLKLFFSKGFNLPPEYHW